MTIDSEAAVAAVLAIHHPNTHDTHCTGCHYEWPCITARACGVTADHVSEATA